MAENRINVPEPPKAVFDVLLDAHRYPEWVIGAKRVRSVDPEWPAAGASFHHALGAGPAELKDATTMLAFEPPRRVELQAHFRPAGAAHIELELAPSEDGAETTVTMRERPVDDPSGVLRTKVVDLLTHARNELALRRLRRLVEQHGSDMVTNELKEATEMATQKQRTAARKNVRKAAKAAKNKKSIAHMPKKTRTALGKQGAAVRQRKRTGASSPKTRAELMRIAQRRDLRGRSKMGRDELARALGES
jgi:uncharacterized protein YndB with AHSA1/START domain